MQTRSSPSLATLHSLARRAAIPDYNKLSKSELYSSLQRQFNIDRLLRAEARGAKTHRSIRIKRPRESCNTAVYCDSDMGLERKKFKIRTASDEINKLDPIMLEPVKDNAFYFMRPNGTLVAFNVDSLVDYLLISGEFYDPETRLPFSDNDLKKIDSLVKANGMEKDSVYEAKVNANELYSELRFRRDALLGLERCTGEIINEFVSIIEDGDDDAELHLLMRVFPSFSDLFRQMLHADREFAKQSMTHWLAFIKGPPNKPNKDYYGLQEIIVQFMKSCLKEP